MNTRLLTTYLRMGANRLVPRIWLESARLNQLGFSPGTGIEINTKENRLELTVNAKSRTNHVSSRRIRNDRCPIIDVNATEKLQVLTGYKQLRASGTYGRIIIQPSIRAFHIARGLKAKAPFRVLELFCGGGTLSQAIHAEARFNIVGGMEVNRDFADIWQESNPEAELIQGDIREVHALELPQFDVLIAGIPCTAHSTVGRAKKSLKGSPELGDTGDLFIPVVEIIKARTPITVVLENVPSFGNSIAGMLIKKTLKQIGYNITELTLEPNTEWGEVSHRRRWVLIASLKGACQLNSPNMQNHQTVQEYLDAPDPEKDKQDAERIANTIAGLRLHNARHAAEGHGFHFTVLTGSETKIPTIVRSYHKINVGPFVKTPFGERLLRQAEIERIQGCKLATTHYRTAVEILGQGVQTRIWKQIARQIADHLTEETTRKPETTQGELELVT